MFNQLAFTNLDEAELQLKDFFTKKIALKSWPIDMVTQLNIWVGEIAEENRHWYGDSVDDFWVDIAENYKDEINEITNNNPSQLLGWQSVQLVLGAGNQTAYSEEKASGVSGVVEIADQQLQEMAKKQEKNNQDINKYLPYIGTAAILIYLFGRSK